MTLSHQVAPKASNYQSTALKSGLASEIRNGYEFIDRKISFLEQIASNSNDPSCTQVRKFLADAAKRTAHFEKQIDRIEHSTALSDSKKAGEIASYKYRCATELRRGLGTLFAKLKFSDQQLQESGVWNGDQVSVQRDAWQESSVSVLLGYKSNFRQFEKHSPDVKEGIGMQVGYFLEAHGHEPESIASVHLETNNGSAIVNGALRGTATRTDGKTFSFKIPYPALTYKNAGKEKLKEPSELPDATVPGETVI